jgi:putative ABC transport system permease protein
MPEWKEEISRELRELNLEPTSEAEIVEELSQHLDDRYVELLASAVTPEEAYRAALAELSESELLVRELRRVERPIEHEPLVLAGMRLNIITDLWQDLRYGLRLLRKSPGFTAVAVLSLALGIGANTAIFSVIDALILKTLPVSRPEELVTFRWDDGSSGPASSFYTFMHPTFEKFREWSQVFSGVSGSWIIGRSNVMINGPGGSVDPGPIAVCLVSGNYFSTLGINAIAGRTFTLDDDRSPGGHPVVVVSHGYWQRRLAFASDVVGRTIRLNETNYTIIGVTPRGFSGEWVGSPADLWIPYQMASHVMPEVPGGPRRFPARVVARLKPGMTIQQAQAASQILYQRLRKEEAGPNPAPDQAGRIAEARLDLLPAAKGLSTPQGDSYRQPLAIVMAVAGLVLLIACANVANLLLARSAARHREMAVRLAIGAGRARIVRQLLAESILLATIGGAIGVLVAFWGTSVLAATLARGPVQLAAQSSGISLDLQPDARSLAFNATLCLLTGILFGLAPAFRASKVSLSPALSERGPGSGGGRFGLGKALVISQIALSLLLLVGAGLFVRTLRNLKSQDLGFDRRQLLLVWTATGQTGRQDTAMADLWHTIQERLSSLPGVVSASAINGGVLTGGMATPGPTYQGMQVEGQPPKQTNVPGGRLFVAPRFFETMGIPVLAGREFTERDNESAPRVMIINEAMARFYFGDQNPVGQRVRLSQQDKATTEIVGVVKEFIKGTPRGAAYPGFTMYIPYRDPEALNRGAQSRLRVMMSVVRTAGDPLTMAARVRQELREIDPNLPVLRINTINEQLDDVLAQECLTATLSGFFGLLALLLVCLGLYGVISYTVARRTNEIGIRLALGATPADVLRMVLKESLWLVLAGIAIGAPATLATTRLISSRLFGVSAADPHTMAVAAVLMIAVSVVAAFLPARRAARIEPMVALRDE